MLKWVSRSSELDIGSGEGISPARDQEVERKNGRGTESLQISHSDPVLLRHRTGDTAGEVMLEDVPLTPDKSSASISRSPSTSSELQPPHFSPSSPRSLDSGVGSSKSSLASEIDKMKGSQEDSECREDMYNNSTNYSLLWENQYEKKKSICVMPGAQVWRDYLWQSSVLVTLPCVLQFPVLALQHGGWAFITVYR